MAEQLLPSLFSLNDINKSLDPIDYEGVIDLFEIVKFSKDKFPYLIELGFEKDKIVKVKLYEDPFYDKKNEVSSAFTGQILNLPNLVNLSNNPEVLKNAFDYLLKLPSRPDTVANSICIAGSSDSVLIIGRAKKSVFEENLPYFNFCKTS